MTSYKILSRHSSLADAVDAAGIDLSYNEDLARRDIRRDDEHVTEAYVLDVNGVATVCYVYDARDIKLLHRYEPFFSCLDNGPIQLAALSRSGDYIDVGDSEFSRDEVKQIQTDRVACGTHVPWATKSWLGI
ncbi:MAG: hypothetical protein Unbinned1322contig1001_16 [Prokaryotic dsDNA virus sp.]|nr:hypothetical protein [Phycisphaerae bacterium]QDP50740.1 MAG: hypothetical protein Unbinned1322contig1001_16 [Prokaryotic dsDNA virus sp.]|tara:strand:+ start:23716 stop:24111 length:396 start_codon:yes stop_codon:yes gene_type:complete